MLPVFGQFFFARNPLLPFIIECVKIKGEIKGVDENEL
jgi:hypothetical protein